MVLFDDRHDAGKKLSELLLEYEHKEEVIILGLPRGGIPVAYEVAIRLNTKLDIFIVRKLGVPFQEELAMGAVALGNVRVLNYDVINALNINGEIIDRITALEEEKLESNEKLYREGLEKFNVKNKITILVDDGLATGATMRAAVKALKLHSPGKIIAAVPVASRDASIIIRDEVYELYCLQAPLFFRGVSSWYRNFAQTTNSEVCNLLKKASLRAIN